MKRKRNKINKVPLSDSNMSKVEMMSANYDPNGAYTGNVFYGPSMPILPEDEEPIQDADDL